jgi:hypothetical protein
LLIKRQVDDIFVENQVWEERLHDRDSALYKSARTKEVKKQDPNDLLLAITNDYAPGPPSSATPMYVFCSVGRTNDTMPLLAQQALKDSGVCPSSLVSIELRSNAAGFAAEEIEVDPAPDQGLVGGVHYRNVRQGPQGNLPRVNRMVVRRKRSRSLDVRMDKRDKVGLRCPTRRVS